MVYNSLKAMSHMKSFFGKSFRQVVLESLFHTCRKYFRKALSKIGKFFWQVVLESKFHLPKRLAESGKFFGKLQTCDVYSVHLLVHQCCPLLWLRSQIWLLGKINLAPLHFTLCNAFWLRRVKKSSTQFSVH